MLTREEYLADPCRVSSIPYWKAKCTRLPGSMKVVHDDTFVPGDRYEDETCFRLIHDLTDLTCPQHPEALYRLCGFAGDDVWHVMRRKHNLRPPF